MPKRPFLLLLLLCTILFFASPAGAEEATLVFPLDTENTHALLLCHKDACALLGGSDAAYIAAQLEELSLSRLSCVVPLCDHEAHQAALAELAARYSVPCLTPGDAFTLGGVDFRWAESTLLFDAPGISYAFGAAELDPGRITFRCDGSLMAFSAETQERTLNVRTELSAQSKRAARFNRGQVLTVVSLQRNPEGEVWYGVRLADGAEGYLRYDLLDFVSAEELAQRAAATPVPEGARYIGNIESRVFHLPSCPMLPAPKNQVWFETRSYAIGQGYHPCGTCQP